ncbi:MAG: hypothetical protein FWH55_13575 [Oscillospiraceae bacterium]|nr:hypothetical protein [Oscillospiraceae bacterium]
MLTKLLGRHSFLFNGITLSVTRLYFLATKSVLVRLPYSLHYCAMAIHLFITSTTQNETYGSQ